MSLLLIWTVLSVVVETIAPALSDIPVIWKRVVTGLVLAPAYTLIALKNLILKVNRFEPLREWLRR